MYEIDAASMAKYLRSHFTDAVRVNDGKRSLEWRLQLVDGAPWVEAVYEEGTEKPKRARFEINTGCAPAARLVGNFLGLFDDALVRDRSMS